MPDFGFHAIMTALWAAVLVALILGAWRTTREIDRASDRWRALKEAEATIAAGAPEAANALLQRHGLKVVRVWRGQRHMYVVRGIHELPPPKSLTAAALSKVEDWG